MYIPLLPLITIATALQELTFSYLNYDRAADFIVWAAWGMVAGSATELVLGPVTFVRLQIEGQMVWPLTGDVRLSARLEAAPTPFSYSHPASSSHEPTVNSPYLSLSPGGREPTRRLSALAPLLAILLDFAIGLYFTSPKTAELPGTPKNLRRREERGDQAPMVDDFDIPPTELRNPIELMARDRQAVHENPAIEAMQPIDQDSGPSSPDSSPLPGSPDAPREERVSSASVEMNSTPTTANSSAGIAAAYEDSAVLENPAAEAEPPKDQESAPLSPDSPLVVGPSDAPQEVDVFSASAGPNRAPATGPARSSSVERWKTEIRARDNVSPLAHKSLKRSSGSLGRVSLAPKSVGTQPGVPRPSRIAAGDSDSARPTTFDPAATPSSVCARQAGSSVVDRVQRATRNTDPSSPDVFFSQAGPSLPPRSSAYVTLGTLAGAYPPRLDSGSQSDGSFEGNAPVAGSSAERWKTGMRARENVSPLAHKGSRRSNGLSLGGVLSAPQYSSSRTRPEEPQAGGSAIGEVEGDRSTWFSPPTTPTPMSPHWTGEDYPLPASIYSLIRNGSRSPRPGKCRVDRVPPIRDLDPATSRNSPARWAAESGEQAS
ncbi:hypothetical protein FRC08_000470 [Ceratobasidium sp. 394]|nr:hypothetical protein FRC08_000470 [Ceratobasidium sp. 394]